MFKQAAMKRKIPYGVASKYRYVDDCCSTSSTPFRASMWMKHEHEYVYFNLCDKIISIYNFIS